MTTPALRTPRLDLVAFADRHLHDAYVAWLNDPEVVRYSEQRHTTHTRVSCDTYRRSFAGTPHHFWAIERRSDGRHVGNMNAYCDVWNATADVGILLGDRSVWGGGYGSEAWRAVCGWLLDTDGGGCRKVTAGTLEPNAGMLGIMRSTGMHPDGRRRRQMLLDGVEVDVVYAAFFADDREQLR